MSKEEFIERRGEAAWEKRLQQRRDWYGAHSKREIHKVKIWQVANHEKVKANSREASRKGGKRYEYMLKYLTTGTPGERARIRTKHGKLWSVFKQIIAPDSQIHHEWIHGTAKYTGVALVESKPHRYGIIDVIKILDGKITLLTEKEVGRGI